VFAIPGIGNAEGGRERVQNLGCDRFSDGLARWAPQSKHNQELGGGRFVDIRARWWCIRVSGPVVKANSKQSC
jgi:hypothetical protein